MHRHLAHKSQRFGSPGRYLCRFRSPGKLIFELLNEQIKSYKNLKLAGTSLIFVFFIFKRLCDNYVHAHLVLQD